MNELIVELTEISPRDFFGNQNANIELIKKYFPKLKIVARGNRITAYGDEEILEEFDERLTMILEHFAKYNKIDENAIERVLSSDSKEDYQTSESSGETLVHGVNGRLIKAQTVNQRKLVDKMKKNDMVFAIGPAGTGKTFLAVAMAVEALKRQSVRKIVLVRPAVEAGESLGYLPGDLHARIRPELDRMGGLVGDRLEELALAADRNPPALRLRDRTGGRSETIEKHPAYEELERYAFGEFGLAAMSHRAGVFGAEDKLPPLVKYALVYLFVQAEFGLCCPVSMPDSLTRTLRKFGDAALVDKYLPYLTTHDMDDIEALCTRVMVIGHGRILSDGNLEDLRARVTTKRRIWTLLSLHRYLISWADRRPALSVDRKLR